MKRVRHSLGFGLGGNIPGKELTKTVMVKIDGRMAMAVLPASYQIGFDRLKQAAGAEIVELAGEEEFKGLFSNCDVGAMPPFGNLYDMDVFVESHLAEDEEIAFNAGSHTELVRLSYKDFEQLVEPKVSNIVATTCRCLRLSYHLGVHQYAVNANGFGDILDRLLAHILVA